MVIPVSFSLFASSTEAVPRPHEGYLTRVAVQSTHRGLRFTFGLRKIPLGEHQVEGGYPCKDPLCERCAHQVSIDGVSVNETLSTCLDSEALKVTGEGGEDPIYAFHRPNGHSEIELLPHEYQATLRFPTRVRPKILLARWERVPAERVYLAPHVCVVRQEEDRHIHPADLRVRIGLMEEGQEAPCAIILMQVGWLLTALTHLGVLLPCGCDADWAGRCLFLVRLPREFRRTSVH